MAGTVHIVDQARAVATAMRSAEDAATFEHACSACSAAYAEVMDAAQAGDQRATSELVRLLGDPDLVATARIDAVNVLFALPAKIQQSAFGRRNWSTDELWSIRNRAPAGDELQRFADTWLVDRPPPGEELPTFLQLATLGSRTHEVALDRAAPLLAGQLEDLLVWPRIDRSRWLANSRSTLAQHQAWEAASGDGHAWAEGLNANAKAVRHVEPVVELRVLLDGLDALTAHRVVDLRLWRAQLENLCRGADRWYSAHADERRFRIQITDGEASQVRSFLATRESMPAPRRNKVANTLAVDLSRTVTVAISSTDPESFLEQVDCLLSVPSLSDRIKEARETGLAWALANCASRLPDIASAGQAGHPQRIDDQAQVCRFCLSWRRPDTAFCVQCGAPVPSKPFYG